MSDYTSQTLTSSERILQALLQARTQLEAVEQKKTEPIAIIGMGCRFPGGVQNPQAYWDLLSNGVDAIAPIPTERWDVNRCYHPDPDAPGKMYVRNGGFIDRVDEFDPEFFGISPREAEGMDPQQRLLLEIAWEALENAGLAPESLKGSATGVFVGIGSDDYSRLSVNSGDLNRIDAYSSLGNARSIAVGRVAYVLGLQGPTMQLDTSCSSSLLGIHLACRSLRTGECNLALAGGVNLMLSPVMTISFCKLKALAPDGRCKTFDAAADGYSRGEGCGVVVLKRLSDAIADGDNILALIRGSAVNHDGKSNGLTAPNGLAQERLIRQALTEARVEPTQIQYVEAHGTGTSLGDPIEVLALARALGQGRSPSEALAIGSVKTNFGHLEAAAGVASLMKVVLSLFNRQIPPHLHFQNPNPHIPWEKLPIVVPKALTPWSAKEGQRFAGVSSFGMSGTNVHIILEAAVREDAGIRGRGDAGKEDKGTRGQGDKGNLSQTLSASPRLPLSASSSEYLFTISAKNEVALRQLAQSYQEFLEVQPQISIDDVCYTTNVGRSHFDYRLAIVTESIAQLQQQLAAFNSGSEITGVLTSPVNSTPSKIAFLFAGQGSQQVGMGQELYATQPTFKAALDKCTEILNPLDVPLLELLWGNSSHLLNQTAYTQPAIFALEYALYQLWQSWGIQPDAVLGHSVGEYIAACVAGVFSLEDGLKLIVARSRFMQALPAGGAMAAVLTDKSKLLEVLKLSNESVVIAAYNSPSSFTIAGPVAAVEAVCQTITAQGGKTQRLSVSHAFHSPLMEPMLGAFATIANTINYHLPQIPLISNLTGQVAGAEIATPEYWVRHIREAVQFETSIQTLHQEGYELFLELSAKPTLLGMARQCFPEPTGVWLPSLRPGQSDSQSLLTSLGQLYVSGATVNWTGWAGNRPGRKVVLPTYPWQRQRYWVKSLSGKPTSKLHPLVDKQLRSPLAKQTFFETRFNTELVPFIADHLVYNEIVVPGASHLSFLLAAAELTFGQPGCLVENIVFPKALAIAKGKERTVQLALTPEETGNSLAAQVLSFENPSHTQEQVSSWIVHAIAQVSANDTTLEPVSWSDIQKRCHQEIPGADLYQAQWERQIELGASFRWLKTVWIGEREALGCLQAPPAAFDASEYQLHPGLIDSCFHLILAATGKINGDETFIPLSIKQFRFFQRPSSDLLWCHARLQHGIESQEDKRVGDLYLFDDAGRVVAEVIGFEARKASRGVLLNSLQSEGRDCFYQIHWQVQEIPSPVNQQAGNWLIFTDGTESGLELARKLEQQGHYSIIAEVGETYRQLGKQHYQLDPTQPEHFRQLLQDIPSLRGVVHLWGLAEDLTDSLSLQRLEDAQTLGCASVLHLVQALVQSQQTQPRLWLVTRNTQAVDDNLEPLQLSQTPLWGLGRVIAIEHPELRCTRLDLPLNSTEQQDIQILLAELLSADKEDQIAYRQGKRYTARLEQVRAQLTKSPVPVKSEASYLITGGLGALGLEVAEWLAQQGAKHLVLVSRRSPSTDAQNAIARLATDGVEVTIITADIANSQEVAQCLQQIRSSHPPLRGIIHAAGVLDDGLLLQQSWEKFNRVMAPKVQGAWNLHTLTQDLAIDFFVCFSSIASLIGSVGQGNYAAANAFMDALASYRQRLGLPGLTINWGPWAETGMAANLGSREQARLKDQGIVPINPEQGLQILGELLTQQIPQVGVMSVDWSLFVKQFSVGTNLQLFEVLAPTSTQVNERSQFLKQLEDCPINARQQLLTTHVRSQIAQILGWNSPEKVEPRQRLFDLGVDSLMAIELKNRLESSLGCSLRTTLLFDYPTLEALVDYLSREVLTVESTTAATVETPQDDELEALLSELEQMSEFDIQNKLVNLSHA
ncbi:MAG: type I polyketide synthase [Nostoc sp. ChiSLP01]|nr:type I polyketide synthase [Nostoc sp. CmiSLP01]MDZ8286535.1 type I polyketide synthase [Nostoc sp. ChiSLP01]